MMEALRSFGLAARFVTGYLYDDTSGATRGGGSTHAWCSAYLPGAGWVEYDPTNGPDRRCEPDPRGRDPGKQSRHCRYRVALSAVRDDPAGLHVDVSVRANPI